MIEIACLIATIVFTILLYIIKTCYDIMNEQKNVINMMKKDITMLYSKVEKNKKEIIAIRNDMTDYFHFNDYNYDDD